MKITKITNSFCSLGVIDSKLNVFDVLMATKYGSSYNSYILDVGDGYILFDTIKLFKMPNKSPSLSEYIENLKKITNNSLKKIKYIVVTHTEPDHSGAILDIIKLCNKNCQILASETAIEYLENIFNSKFNARSIKDKEELKIGNKTLIFNHIPMMHWPDSIFTIIKEEKIAVTCDTFGTHYALDSLKITTLEKNKIKDYKESYVYYYESVMCHYKMFVQMAVARFKENINLIDIIATGHGPILDNKKWVERGINEYERLSKNNLSKNPTIIFLNSSAYCYTTEIMEVIKKTLTKEIKGVIFKIYNIDALTYNEKIKIKIVSEIKKSQGLLIGTPTLNNDAVPFIHEILAWLSPPENFQKYAGCYGSYGWSGEAVRNITQKFSQIRMKTIKGLLVRFRMSEEQKKYVIKWAGAFSNYINTGIIEEDFQYKNNNLMKKTIWKQ